MHGKYCIIKWSIYQIYMFYSINYNILICDIDVLPRIDEKKKIKF